MAHPGDGVGFRWQRNGEELSVTFRFTQPMICYMKNRIQSHVCKKMALIYDCIIKYLIFFIDKFIYFVYVFVQDQNMNYHWFFPPSLPYSAFPFLIFMYLAALGLSCSMWDLVPILGLNQSPLCWIRSLSHWTMREVPISYLQSFLQLPEVCVTFMNKRKQMYFKQCLCGPSALSARALV